jgi:hypothetical protein
MREFEVVIMVEVATERCLGRTEFHPEDYSTSLGVVWRVSLGGTGAQFTLQSAHRRTASKNRLTIVVVVRDTPLLAINSVWELNFRLPRLGFQQRP